MAGNKKICNIKKRCHESDILLKFVVYSFKKLSYNSATRQM